MQNHIPPEVVIMVVAESDDVLYLFSEVAVDKPSCSTSSLRWPLWLKPANEGRPGF